MTTLPQPQWTHAEFLAYFLLFAAHADIQYNDDERRHILSKVDQNTYDRVWTEFSNDTDYMQIQKIIQYYELRPTLSLANLLEELRALFLSDNHFHLMEKATLNSMRRMLR